MTRRTPAPALALAVALAFLGAACSREPHFSARDIKSLLLQPYEAPAGTSLDQGSSGPQNLSQFAGKDTVKRDKLRAAGFVTSYFELFVSPELFDKGDPNKLSGKGSLATSFALLFGTSSGAERGLAAVEEAVHRDGRGLREISSEGLGDQSFGLVGLLQPGLPPGYLYAWRTGNGVFGVVAAGAPGTIDENAARALADRMAGRAR